MATNPRIPDRHDVTALKEQQKRKVASPLVPLGILVAALLLIALIIWLPRTPKTAQSPDAASVPVQPTGSQVQLSDLRITPSTVGSQIYVYGRLFNTGDTAITGAQVLLSFQGPNGQNVGTVTALVQRFQNGTGVNLVDQPIKPNDSGNIRIAVEHAPQNWNHEMPGITVQTVTAAGAK